MNKLKAELDASSKRLNELESYIAAKDASEPEAERNLVQSFECLLKEKDQPLNKKWQSIYVSMKIIIVSNQSWAVGVEGKKAVG